MNKPTLGQVAYLTETLNGTQFIKQFDTTHLADVLSENMTESDRRMIWSMLYAGDKTSVIKRLTLWGLKQHEQANQS